jgi:hypothetical protein
VSDPCPTLNMYPMSTGVMENQSVSPKLPKIISQLGGVETDIVSDQSVMKKW